MFISSPWSPGQAWPPSTHQNARAGQPSPPPVAGCARGIKGSPARLAGGDLGMDSALSSLYDADKGQVGMGKSAPHVARWLGDIRGYFPSSVVRVMQRDALERLDLKRLLLEPEMLEAVEPDVHLVANLIALRDVMP